MTEENPDYKKTGRTMGILLWFIAIMFLVSMVYSLFINLFPFNIIEVEEPFKILNENKTVKVNDRIEYEFSYCKNWGFPGNVSRFFIDGVRIPIDQYPETIKKGCGTFRDFVIVSPNIAPGKYHLEVNRDYVVQNYRHITYKLISEAFEVVSEEKCPYEPTDPKFQEC